MPEVYEFLEAERIKYAIRLSANQVLQSRIGYLLTRPVGRPPHHVRRFHANFSYQAGTWTKPRRVIAKVEWHPGELYPRVGFIVTNMSRPAERVVAFYNKRGTCEQWIKEGKGAIKWTRLSCRTFAANAVRLQLHALAYNLGNFVRTMATPEPMSDWSLTTRLSCKRAGKTRTLMPVWDSSGESRFRLTVATVNDPIVAATNAYNLNIVARVNNRFPIGSASSPPF